MIVRPLINLVKHLRDALQSMSLPGKLTLGREDQWTIYTPNLIEPIVFSGGAGKNISFELELLKRFKATIHLFDPTQTGITTVLKAGPQEGLHFHQVALSNYDGTLQLFFPVDPMEGSFTKAVHRADHVQTTEFPCRSIPSLVKELGCTKIDILKLDIEGAEYEVLDDVLGHRIPVDQICVEFHHFFDSIPKSTTDKMMSRLVEANYVRIHRSEVNYTFIHKRLLSNK